MIREAVLRLKEAIKQAISKWTALANLKCLALNITLPEFFAEERPQLGPELPSGGYSSKAFAGTKRISSEVAGIDE